MNHITKKKNLAITVGALAAITAALTASIAINLQTVAAYTKDPNGNNATDIENSETNFSFKQKLKNNCSGFTVCCNAASQSIGLARIPICVIPIPPPT